MGKIRMHATAGHVDFTFLGSLIECLEPPLAEQFCLKHSFNELFLKICTIDLIPGAQDVESQYLHLGAIFTARKRSCGKVMFLQVSVILLTGGGCVSQHALQVYLTGGGCVSQHALQV